MKRLIINCSQPRAYVDSKGICLIELEGEETIQDVIDEYVNPKIEPGWWETIYSSPRELTEYTQNLPGGNIVHVGRLVLMNTTRAYTG